MSRTDEERDARREKIAALVCAALPREDLEAIASELLSEALRNFESDGGYYVREAIKSAAVVRAKELLASELSSKLDEKARFICNQAFK